MSTNPIVVTYGSCIDIDFDFLDEDVNPEDISGDEFGILTASSPAFQQAEFTKTDAASGKLHMFLSADHARDLRMGNVNWFRLQRAAPGGCEDNTTQIWVQVI